MCVHEKEKMEDSGMVPGKLAERRRGKSESVYVGNGWTRDSL